MRHIHNAPVPASAGGWGPCAAPPLSTREAARQRHPLDGSAAQTLELALTITERERDEARKEADFNRREKEAASAFWREREADVINALDAAGAPKTAGTLPRPERRLSLGERIDHLAMARDKARRKVRRLEEQLAEVEADLEEAEREQDEGEGLDELEAEELETSRDVLRRMELEFDRHQVPEAAAGPLGVYTRFADAAERVAWLAQERLRLEDEVKQLREGLAWAAEAAERTCETLERALEDRSPQATIRGVCQDLRERVIGIGSLLPREKKEVTRVA